MGMNFRFIPLLLAVASTALADPQLTSWFTANSGKYARIYTTTANQTSGTTATTWSRGQGTQSSPAYAGVNEVNSSASWVYIRTTGLASHVMGPWYLDANKAMLFPNYPANTATVYRIPRAPTIPGTKTLTGNGAIGFFVNGVAFFDNRDAFSYSTSNATDATPVNGITGDGIWNRNAYANELVTFDAALAHQAGKQYHYHVQPIALRYQLGDHVTYNATANTYAEATGTAAHSPIVAWAADGLPVYGPYGYSDPTNAASGARRMVSGFVARNGSNNTTNLSSTGRTTLPAWAASAQGRSQTLSSGQYGPAVNATYAIGHYIEDYDYLGDLGFTRTTGSTVRDFDLDQYNCRYCITPEFPGGTYAYFSTIDASNAPAFPYNIGRQFFGSPTGGATTAAVMNADTPLTQQFLGGANSALAINTPSVNGTSVTLTWSAVEGGTYSVDASQNQSTWTSKATGIVSTGTSANSTYTALGTSGTEYGRVNRTALATYDTTGQTAANVSQTTTRSYNLSTNVAPTLTNISTLTGAVKNNPFTITYATLAAAADEADTNGDAISFRIEAISSGTLTKNGTAVSAGSTLISSGDSVVWTPSVNYIGTTAAFTVKAYDGSLASSAAVPVNVTVIDGNSAPTLTTINTLTGATEDTAYGINYTMLATAADEADLDGDTLSFRIEAVSSGTLTKGGGNVTPGSTLIFNGDSVVWTPAANANGTLAAFTLKAYDGTTTSASAVTVNVATTAVNDAPTLTTISTLTDAVKNTAYTIGYAALAAAANELDVDGDSVLFRIEAVSSGTLTKGGAAVTAGTTTIASGESLVWTPATNATGTLAAFTVKAYDGTLASSAAVVNVTVSASVPNPQLTSWHTANTGKYARLCETDAELAAGTTKTTWTRNTLTQSSPVYAGVTQVDYSAGWVYFRTPSLATYLMGPWYNTAARSDSALFVNIPKNQGLIVRIPRTSTLTAIPGTKTATMGYMVSGVLQDAIGFLVDGVSIFDPLDGYTYSGGTEAMGGGGQWHRDAYVNEGITFDKSLAHQQNTGKYHNHANPIALRYQLGDAVSYDTGTKSYSETLAPTQHSPIIGWMHDGLPIYGPYGYSSALDSTSPVRRMIGGFVKRDGTTTGVDNITTAGRTVPTWAIRNGASQIAGPAVSTTYPLARYIEDWAYLGDLIKTGSTTYQQGVDFDLNEYNVRYCVTPEFPGGTYAYFLNISSTGTPQFPYMCNRWFYGTPTGSTVTSISETVTNQFTGGPNRPLAVPAPPEVSGTTVTLTWNAVEGGTYSVDASTNGSSFTSKATGLTVTAANSKTTSYTALGTSGTEYARVNRTALATYDTTGTATATVSQTTTTPVTFPNNAPTLTSISALTGASEYTPFTISYATLAAAADEADLDGNPLSFRIESVTTGTLTKDGIAISAGSTLLSTGENVVWTPATGASGLLSAITVRAWDGSLASSTAVQVYVNVAAGTFASWAAACGLDATNNGFNADPEGDGIANGLELVLGGAPRSSSSSVLPTASNSGGYFTFTFTRTDDSEGKATLVVQYSTDFSTWTSVPVGATSSTSGGVIVTVAENGTANDTITVQIPVSAETKIFARLIATMN
jgi:hypothetical protein